MMNILQELKLLRANKLSSKQLKVPNVGLGDFSGFSVKLGSNLAKAEILKPGRASSVAQWLRIVFQC